MSGISETDQIRRWRGDPNGFVRDMFGVEPSSQQVEFMDGVRDVVWAKLKLYARNTGKGEPYGPITSRDEKLNPLFGASVMSGVGTGKGAAASWIIIWFLTCFPNPKIVCTSPSARQMSITLWAELAKWHQKCKLKDWFVWQSDKFFLKELEGQNWFAATRTANARNSPEEQAETLAGLHEDFLMIIGDEASGIGDAVFRPLESTLTRKCNFCLLFFNPTKSKGFAYDSHHRNRDQWLTYRWNAEESSIVTKNSIEILANKYGKDSNTYMIRVLGLPPVAGENYIIPWEYIESATELELDPASDDDLIMSLDVGAGGDDSCFLPRKGPRVYELAGLVSSFQDSAVLAHWAAEKVIDRKPKMVLIDNIGVGWGVTGHIRELLPAGTTKLVEVNVAQTAFNPQRFFRLRDELWWRLRLALEAGQLQLPNDPLLMGDLNSPKYEEVAGKIKVESKKDMKARGVDSPNRADSLMQTMIYEPTFLRRILSGLKPSGKKKKSNVNWRTV